MAIWRRLWPPTVLKLPMATSLEPSGDTSILRTVVVLVESQATPAKSGTS